MPDTSLDQIMRVRLGHANVYLLLFDRQAILIDAGTQRQEHVILEALLAHGLPPEALRLIVVTHTHYDHCGSLCALKQITGAQVLVHAAEADDVRRGYRALPGGTDWFAKIPVAVGRRLNQTRFSYPPVTPDIIIADRFDLGDLGVDGYLLPTPGHTSGSISLIWHNRHVFAGDAIYHVFPNSVFPPFADDVAELLRSWEKLLATGCEFFYPGHGAPFNRDLLQRSYEAQKQRRQNQHE